jgi:hypothetical protein
MEALIINGREPITEQQMYEMYEVNKDFRETDRITHNNWTTTIKTKEGDIAQTMNHQTKLLLKPKYGSMIPEWSVEIMENLLKD